MGFHEEMVANAEDRGVGGPPPIRPYPGDALGILEMGVDKLKEVRDAQGNKPYGASELASVMSTMSVVRTAIEHWCYLVDEELLKISKRREG